MIHDVNKTRKILMIFADSSVHDQKADPEELRRLVQKTSDEDGRNVEVYVTTARALSFFVSNDFSRIYDHKNKYDLREYDFVYFRKAGTVMQQMLACARYLESHGIPYADREIGQSTSRNKLSQMFMLQANGLSVPTTLFVRNRKRLVRLLQTTYKDNFTWPVIAKATGGTRGDANYLVQTPDDLEKLVHQVKRHFLIQSFIPNDGDFRALVIHDSLRGLIKRVGEEGSHLNNTSKNGQAEWLPLETFSHDHQLLAVRAAQIFKRDIAGVDVLFDKHTDQPYILEVNRAPQIDHASYPEEKARVLLDGIIEIIDDYQKGGEVSSKRVLGRRESVTLSAFPHLGKVTAKIDTGAYSNALHVEYIEEVTNENGERMLHFSPTKDKKDVYATPRYSRKKVASSNGMSEERYVVELEFVLGDESFLGQVTLSDRGKMINPVLIGRKFLKHHGFLVDPAKRFTA